MHSFTAIAAIKNYLILGANATDAYAQSLPPSNPTFMRIDDQYAKWYKNKFGIDASTHSQRWDKSVGRFFVFYDIVRDAHPSHEKR